MSEPQDQVLPDFARSSYSSGGQNCVEVAALGAIALHDSKRPDGPIIRIGADEFGAFTRAVKDGQL
ncbi:DUF397 domain-containing protein [Streptomyces hesseae]|uniref:DUF397 domain-containing protein n=1 Tax=Streptomyces hesseae TaxID=3075519 RepID=A0ABU2SPR5_9ACTN|nr:DUF397 domain-containing protein [Streptomyces sp. DSM 40473]MDT0450988.1 DUF397 domain-containing protein [Streptomyces sp. DSM 40473]